MTVKRKSATASRRRTGTVKAILAKLPSAPRGGITFRSVSRMSAVRYIAGGLALYGLVRIAMKMTSSYPQIGEFFSENLDTVEDKFRTWTGRESDEIADSAH